MGDETAGPSNTKGQEFDEKYMQKVQKESVEWLMVQLDKIRDGNHPLLTSARRKVTKAQQIQIDRIQRHRDRATERAKIEFDTTQLENEAEHDTRMAELHYEAKKRINEMEKHVSHEYGVIDITKPFAAQISTDANKKTLRGRGGGQLIEPATYFNSNQNTRIPEFNLNLAFDNAKIRKDLDAIWNRPAARREVYYIVSITKPKLVIDNKSFKHGEDVLAWNRVYGDVIARLEIIHDKLINLKGLNLWDNRQITATLEDMEEGRVLIHKLKGR